jgi:hypothetical protein
VNGAIFSQHFLRSARAKEDFCVLGFYDEITTDLCSANCG